MNRWYYEGTYRACHHEMVILNSRHHERAIAGDPGQYKDGLPRSLSELVMTKGVCCRLTMTDRGRM